MGFIFFSKIFKVDLSGCVGCLHERERWIFSDDRKREMRLRNVKEEEKKRRV